MLKFVRTNNTNLDFLSLIHLLDEGLKVTDGDEFNFYKQFNQLDDIKHVLLAYQDDLVVGCGAIKTYDAHTMEVKRMFVRESQRGKGIATQILVRLEAWMQEFTCTHNILETGIRQFSAIALYKRSGYKRIPNFGQYIEVDDSHCFLKEFSK